MTYKLVFEGDSLTSDVHGGGTTMPSHVSAHLLAPAPSSVSNVAGGGETVVQMATQASVQVDPLYDGAQTSILSFWAGTNDLYFGADGPTAAANFASYCQARKTAHSGWKIIAATMLPRTTPGTPAGFEAERQVFNTSLRTNWATWADQLVDLGADSRIGAPGASNNATYFYTDLVHTNDTGREVVATLMVSAILAVLGLSPAPTPAALLLCA